MEAFDGGIMTTTPRIAVFYGFKGGAGRSFLLASIAAALAAAKKRVLVIDADLEAPGLGDFFDVSATDGGDWRAKKGLLDILAKVSRDPDEEDVRQKFRQVLFTESADWDPATETGPLSPNVVSRFRYGADSSDAGIWLMGPGSHEADRLAGPQRYIRKLTEFDWVDFLSARKGGAMLGLLMEELTKGGRFDHVLIDARTGYNFASLVLLRGLATDVVAVSTQFIQSLDGMARVLPILAVGSRTVGLRTHLVIAKYTDVDPADGPHNEDLEDIGESGGEDLRQGLIDGWFEENPHYLPFVENFSRGEGHLFLRFPDKYRALVEALENRSDRRPEVEFLRAFRDIVKDVTGLRLDEEAFKQSFSKWRFRFGFDEARGDPVTFKELKSLVRKWVMEESTPKARARSDTAADDVTRYSPAMEILRRGLLERESLRWYAANEIEEALEKLKDSDEQQRLRLREGAKNLDLHSLPFLPPGLSVLLNPPAEEHRPATSTLEERTHVPLTVYRLVKMAVGAGIARPSATAEEWEALSKDCPEVTDGSRGADFLAAARAVRQAAVEIWEGRAGTNSSLDAAHDLASAVTKLGGPGQEAELTQWNGWDFVNPLAEAVLVNAIAVPPDLSDDRAKLTTRLAEIVDSMETGLMTEVKPDEEGADPEGVHQWLSYASTTIFVRRALALLDDPDGALGSDPLQDSLANLCRDWMKDFDKRKDPKKSDPKTWDGFLSAATMRILLDRDAIVRGEEDGAKAHSLDDLRSSLARRTNELFEALEARGARTDSRWTAPLYALLTASNALGENPLESRIARHLLAVLRSSGVNTGFNSATTWMHSAAMELGLGFSVDGSEPTESQKRIFWIAEAPHFFAGRFGAAKRGFEKRLLPARAFPASECGMLAWYAGILALLADLSAAEAWIADHRRHRPLGARLGSAAGFISSFATAEALRCAAAHRNRDAIDRLGGLLDREIEVSPGRAPEDKYILLARLARCVGNVRTGALSAEDGLYKSDRIVAAYDSLMACRAQSHADADYANAVGYPWSSLGMFTGKDVPTYRRRDHALLQLSRAEIALRAGAEKKASESLERAARFIGAEVSADGSPTFDNEFLKSLEFALYEPRALWAAFRAHLAEGDARASFAKLAEKQRSDDLEAEDGVRANRHVFFDPVWELTDLDVHA